jgi:hypothetical protein
MTMSLHETLIVLDRMGDPPIPEDGFKFWSSAYSHDEWREWSDRIQTRRFADLSELNPWLFYDLTENALARAIPKVLYTALQTLRDGGRDARRIQKSDILATAFDRLTHSGKRHWRQYFRPHWSAAEQEAIVAAAAHILRLDKATHGSPVSFLDEVEIFLETAAAA